MDSARPDSGHGRVRLKKSSVAAGQVPRSGRAPSHGKVRRPGPTHFRMLLWVVEFTLLLAVVEHFVFRRARRASETGGAARAKALPVGAAVIPLGASARELTGLREVADAHFAHLDGLAPGSEAAKEAQSTISRDLRLPVELQNSVGMRFRLVAPGTFLMGSPEPEAGRWEGEVQHVAILRFPYYIGKCEVTQTQWNAVMGSTPFPMTRRPTTPTAPISGNPSHFRSDDRPVEEVTWYDCQRFAVQLCEKEGVAPGTYRLPTEQEWEYACRAGTGTAYCFGDVPARLKFYADYEGNNFRRTNGVARRLPNAYGLHDMHGNVWEWCLDPFKGYAGRNDSPPESEGEWRVVRGGNWHEPAESCRSANRCRLPPASHGNLLGFRLVRALPELAVD